MSTAFLGMERSASALSPTCGEGQVKMGEDDGRREKGKEGERSHLGMNAWNQFPWPMETTRCSQSMKAHSSLMVVQLSIVWTTVVVTV